MDQIVQFAATEGPAQSQNLFEALGIDAQLLIVQVVSFLILLAILRKFVYPTLIKAIDERQAKIEEGSKAAAAAEARAAKSEAEISKMLKEARVQADTIVATAHKEAAVMVEDADSKAKKRAEHIVSEARAQLDQDVREARSALKKETVELVALATETIIKQKIDTKRDAALIENALKEAR